MEIDEVRSRADRVVKYKDLGRHRRAAQPTARGNSQEGEETGLVDEAQHEVMKTGPRLKGQAWTAEDDERLKSMIEASVSIDLIAAKMKRTTQGVKSRAHALGISTKRVWVGLRTKGK